MNNNILIIVIIVITFISIYKTYTKRQKLKTGLTDLVKNIKHTNNQVETKIIIKEENPPVTPQISNYDYYPQWGYQMPHFNQTYPVYSNGEWVHSGGSDETLQRNVTPLNLTKSRSSPRIRTKSKSRTKSPGKKHKKRRKRCLKYRILSKPRHIRQKRNRNK